MIVPQTIAALNLAAKATGIPAATLQAHNSSIKVCRVRDSVWYALWMAGHSYNRIGITFKRDHTTVSLGVMRHMNLVKDMKMIGKLSESMRQALLSDSADRKPRLRLKSEQMRQRAKERGTPRLPDEVQDQSIREINEGD